MTTLPEQPDGTDPVERLPLLKEVVESCRERANRNGERFNIFSILRAQRDETATHSRFLAELLDPAGRHGEGTRFLEEFILGPLNRSESISDPVRIIRESPSPEGRRIDIAIETPS